ncbi:hypothetical protein [Actinokineospora diospyrosa]|uniref:WD40 repeat protein n=1 Tax=Actinokineospora diospyrosa TaxID=103728 RepID=A0ABT1I510_9PSEU|nr:hypothetical protein [Actinokineospora diospyrosa]MCP2267526.1 hypothetical protein [Actinokineospora diospyrosa]
MRTRALVTVLVATLVAAGCGGPDGPPPLALTKVDLPGAPVTLTPSGGALLIGLHRDGQPVVPALVRRDASGAVTEIPTTTATPYGKLARWTQIATDGTRLFAVGGERGGAHGNVRWSVWDGALAGLTEKRQAFSTFGGYGAGDLVGVVITPAGPVVLGGWDNPNGGFDVATWLPSGDDWIRQPSAGTALEASREALPFPIAATPLGDGIMIVGWQFADGREQPVAWRSKSGNTGWTKTPLPAPPTAHGAAMSVSCSAAECVAAGRLDSTLALWRLTGDTWSQLPDVPTFPVSDTDVLPAPAVTPDGTVVQFIGTPDGLKALRRTGTTWTVHSTTAKGKPTAATTVGTTIYTVVDDALWSVDITKLP